MPSAAPAQPQSLNYVELLRSPVSSYLSQFVRAQVESERSYQLACMRRNDLYYHGKQYLTLVQQYGVVDYRPVSPGGPLSPTYNSSAQVYDYVLNVMKGDIWKFISVLGARSPNVQAMARDLKNEAQNSLRITADRLSQYLRFHWDLDQHHRDLCSILAKYGTAFSYARFVADKSRFGETEIPNLRQIDVPSGPAFYACPRCGTETPMDQAHAQPSGMGATCPVCAFPLSDENLIIPEALPSLVIQGSTPYANGSVDLDIANASSVTCPHWFKRIDQLPWLLYEYEEDKGKLAQANPQFRKEIIGSDANTSEVSAMGSYTRDLLQSPVGVPYTSNSRPSRALYTRLWIAPCGIEYLPNDTSGNLREQTLSQFPMGVKATLVNGKLIKIEGASLRGQWASCSPQPAESIYAPAYFDDYIQAQDVINDGLNSIIEAMERSSPITVVHPDVLDIDRMQKYSIVPGEFLFSKPTAGQNFSQQIFRIPAAEINPSIFNVIETYIAKVREISGIQPAIFGADQSDTARQAEINRNQALMQLGTVWNQIRSFWSRTMENAAMELASNAIDDKLYLEGGTSGRPEIIEIPGLHKLLQGGWFYQCEETIPMTPGQRRDWFMQMFQQATTNPQAMQLSGLGNPANLKRFQEAIGSSDWVVPGVDERAKVMGIIHKLLQASPIPGEPGPLDPMTGIPGPPAPPQPSIPYDPTFFTPELDLEILKEWIMGDDNDEEDKNPGGYANVLAWGQQVLQASAPPPPQPEPKAPTLALSANLKDMLPEQEAAVFQQFNIPFGGGTAGPGGPAPMPDPNAPMMPPGGPPDSGGGPSPSPVPPAQGLESPPSGGLTPETAALAM